MEIFNAIGLPIPKGKTLNDLAADAEKLGEASIYARPDCVLYGRCWRIGAGLEVWTILYESENGETFYADCRPGFRAKYKQNIEKWSLYEDRKEGEAAIRGFVESRGNAEVFFQLQNLTEVGAKNFDAETLRVGLGGLAVCAEVSTTEEEFVWQPLHEATETFHIEQTYRRLCGRIKAFEILRNPHSEKDLYWIHLALKDFDLEILVNRKDLRGDLSVGRFVKADVWLQGHIVSKSTYYSSYEGVDWSAPTADFWKNFKRQN